MFKEKFNITKFINNKYCYVGDEFVIQKVKDVLKLPPNMSLYGKNHDKIRVQVRGAYVGIFDSIEEAQKALKMPVRDEEKISFRLTLSKTLHTKFKKLGGRKWLIEQINLAKEK